MEKENLKAIVCPAFAQASEEARAEFASSIHNSNNRVYVATDVFNLMDNLLHKKKILFWKTNKRTLVRQSPSILIYEATNAW
jgi:hypothetical protein